MINFKNVKPKRRSEMDNYQIIMIVLGSGSVLTFVKWIHGKLAAQKKKTEALELGVQALLRDRLYQMYAHYMHEGVAPIYARENFENMYQRYHNLGANGVMDDYYKKFMEIPTE